MSANTEAKPTYQETPGGPFAKGNPGKPKGARHLTTKIMEAIERVSEGSTEPKDSALVKKLIEMAEGGDMQAMKLIFNYVDGMPVQGLELGGPDGGPITVVTRVPEPE
jgi:hypothetical protein